jgi:imidazolonepropionase
VGARSADHLVHVDPDGIAALRAGGVIATLLPIAAFYLKLGRFAPARDLIAAGVPVALATDLNPGGGFSPSMPFAMTLACFGMAMTAEEALVAPP